MLPFQILSDLKETWRDGGGGGRGWRAFHTQVSDFSPPEVKRGSSKAASWLSLKAFPAQMRFFGECLHSECEHKSDTFIFWTELQFSELSPETSPNHVSSAAAAATSTTMADKLVVSRHQTRSERQQSIADHLLLCCPAAILKCIWNRPCFNPSTGPTLPTSYGYSTWKQTDLDMSHGDVCTLKHQATMRP